MKPRRPTDARAPLGQVRIIGGRLRGSRLEVPPIAGLRPTSDRVRETLFNWLQPQVGGAHCIDLFAGSGALGFEAASRGASSVLMLERDPDAAARLRAASARLQAEAIEIECTDALSWLARPPGPRFDLAFVDPPFDAGLLDAALAALQPWLRPQAWIYVEAARGPPPRLPPGWILHREGETREVRYALYHLA